MPEQVYYQGTSADVRRLIWGLVQGLDGHAGAHAQLVLGIKYRVGLTALFLITEDFKEKAAGGADAAGIQWEPLKPETIAARRVGLKDARMLRGLGIHDKGGSRPFLTAGQDKRWRMLFATRKAWFEGKFGLSEGEASARAAAVAWATLKSEGARTKLEVLGSRHVEIGRDTGRLLASLGPGVESVEAAQHYPLNGSPPSPPAPAETGDRILRAGDPGKVIVGSNVVYAGRFHAKRPLWPSGDLPGEWNDKLAEAAKLGVLDAVVMVLEGSG